MAERYDEGAAINGTSCKCHLNCHGTRFAIPCLICLFVSRPFIISPAASYTGYIIQTWYFPRRLQDALLSDLRHPHRGIFFSIAPLHLRLLGSVQAIKP